MRYVERVYDSRVEWRKDKMSKILIIEDEVAIAV